MGSNLATNFVAFEFGALTVVSNVVLVMLNSVLIFHTRVYFIDVLAQFILNEGYLLLVVNGATIVSFWILNLTFDIFLLLIFLFSSFPAAIFKDVQIGQRMITISTVGVPNTIKKLATHKLQSTLAVR